VCPQISSVKVHFFSEMISIHALSGKDCPKWHQKVHDQIGCKTICPELCHLISAPAKLRGA
jgi:hypothetical protein